MTVRWCRGKEGWSWHSGTHAHSTDGEKEARFSSPAHFTPQIQRRRAKTHGGHDVNHNLRTSELLQHLCLISAAPSSGRNLGSISRVVSALRWVQEPSTEPPVRRLLPYPAAWNRAALRTRAFEESPLKKSPTLQKKSWDFSPTVTFVGKSATWCSLYFSDDQKEQLFPVCKEKHVLKTTLISIYTLWKLWFCYIEVTFNVFYAYAADVPSGFVIQQVGGGGSPPISLSLKTVTWIHWAY